MDRKTKDEQILKSLVAFKDKTSGRQKEAINYQISQLEKRLNRDENDDLFKIKTSKKHLEAKIFKESQMLENIEKTYENEVGIPQKVKEKKEFLYTKLYFLKKERKDALDIEQEVDNAKTTGNVKIQISKISINPIFECKNLVFVVDSEIKCNIKPDFVGELNISFTNSIEFEIIVFGENGSIISLLFFPCEYFTYHKETRDHVIDLKDGYLETKITFEKKTKLIRRNAEVICVIEAGHSLETYKSFSPFKCCVCHQFTAMFSSAYRCYKCLFTCHKQCAKFIFFHCFCTEKKEEKLHKRYDIPHRLQQVNSVGVSWCGHCGMRIPIAERGFKCTSCNLNFHKSCVDYIFNSCGITFEMRCAISEFNPPVHEIEQPKQILSIKDFSLIKVLGRGSFGKVMLAKHTKDDKIIALKILKKEMLVDANETAYLELERKVLKFATISNHPFLMQMVYCFQDNRQIFFGTEFLSGGDLFHHAAKIDFTHKQIKLYAAEILMGIQFLHENNIIYRDMKLDNVLINKDGHIKIADFGLCKDNFGPFAVTFTYCGTPTTMAPEVILQGGYTKDADWWSYGIVLYEMFEGEPPFDGATRKEIAQGILAEEIIFEKTPEKARDLLTKLLQKDPKLRIGHGLEDGNAIREHPYFSGMDWEDVYNKIYRPPFIPQTSLDDNFDAEFIEEEIILTPCSSVRNYDDYFTNFK